MSQELHDTILNELIRKDHGLWYQFVECKTAWKDRRRPQLVGEPSFSREFCKLYEYEDAHDYQSNGGFRKSVTGEDRRRVIWAIEAALRNDGSAINHTIRVRTKGGHEKVMEVYLRRLALGDGREVLASFHSDLTAASDRQLIYRKVLDELPGFVFVKEWDFDQQKFVFRFVNVGLARSFGLGSPEDAVGKSDEDFIDNKEEIKRFRETDELVRDAPHSSYRSVREERVTPKKSGDKNGVKHVTIKMPYSSPTRQGTAANNLVLGISVDVTSITEVLSAVVQESDDAIYVKDREFRYQVVNDNFVKLMGLKSQEELLYRRFEDVIKTNERLNDEVRKEDKLALSGKSVSHVRTARFHDSEEWQTSKKPIHTVPGRPATHVLGVARPLFRGPTGDLLYKLPQCVCVKRCDEQKDGKMKFPIVWANQRYLQRHNATLEQIRGKTDKELWKGKQYRGQASNYNSKDKIVIKIGKKVRPKTPWPVLEAELLKNDCWEFREEQIGYDGRKTQLQTTKWPEFIEPHWYVVVVYSDVTKGDSEVKRYHEMTVHTIRGAFNPVDIAMSHLDDVAEGCEPESAQKLKLAQQSLSDAADNVQWFLEHHMELLRMQVKLRKVSADALLDIIRIEMEKLKRSCPWPISIELGNSESWTKNEQINGDLQFLRAVFVELFRNAKKAIGRMVEVISNVKKDRWSLAAAQKEGWNFESLHYRPYLKVTLESDARRLSIVIADNGAACSNATDRKMLRKKYRLARRNPHSENLRLGLAFCFLALEEHSASFNLVTDIETAFCINIPLITNL